MPVPHRRGPHRDRCPEVADTDAASTVTPRGDGRTRPITIVVIACLALAVLVAGGRAAALVRSFQRLHATHISGDPNDPAALQSWVPLSVVSRRYQVPVQVLLDGLRADGFTVEPQAIYPDVPDAVRRRIGGLTDRRGTGRPPPLLPPERQSLHQIATHSGKSVEAAIASARKIIAEYRKDHPLLGKAPKPLEPPRGPRPAGSDR